MNVLTLGTGGCYANLTRGGAATAVGAGEHFVLIDAGENVGPSLLAAELATDRIGAILFTHYHTDHTAGLAPFLFTMHVEAKRKRPLLIAGPAGLMKLRDGLAQAFGAWVGQPSYPIEWREIEAPGTFEPVPGLKVEFAKVEHAPELTCVGYRVTDGVKVVAVSGDSTLNDGLRRLARGADVLVAEAGYPAEAGNAAHVTPRQLGEMARQLGVGRLILTHFAHPETEGRLVAEARQAFGGVVEPAEDGDRYVV